MVLFWPNIRKLAKKKNVKGLIKAFNYRKNGKVRRDAASTLGELRR